MALNFSRSIIAVYLENDNKNTVRNRVAVGQGNFRKNTNNQIQNGQSSQ